MIVKGLPMSDLVFWGLVIWFSFLGIALLRQLNYIRWYVAKINGKQLGLHDYLPQDWRW